MKRSEWMEIARLVWDWRSPSAAVYAYDAEEAAYENGKDSQKEYDADALDSVLAALVVDDEDVALCTGELKGSWYRSIKMHVEGSYPESHMFTGVASEPHGCATCTKFRELQQEFG